MAERRMFAKTIIDSDAFLDMPMTARLLYYDLAMRADDDGFVNAPKKIMRFVGASEDDLQTLASKKFIISFESGIICIKHWRINNYIRKDTYTSTKYKKEISLLMLDENNAYTLANTENTGMSQVCNRSVTSTSRNCDESVTGTSTQVRLGKDSIDKNSIDKYISKLNDSSSVESVDNVDNSEEDDDDIDLSKYRGPIRVYME